MRDLLSGLMDAAALRCDYADVRHVRSLSESIATRNGRVDEVERHGSEGVGVRVRRGAGWGFAATRELSKAGLEEALDRALAVTEAQPSAPARQLTGEPPATGRHGSRRE